MSWLRGVVFSAVAACASKPPPVRMVSSPDVPAARGRIETEITDNANLRLTIRVQHLAPPERVNPRATTYVVWARPLDGSDPQNIGALRVNADLEGALETVTPLRQFDVFITAEPVPNAARPTGGRLLSASISQRTRD